MALELKISIDSYDRATHTVTINDDTGVYNAGTNPGGYGAPNPERNTFALVISTIRRVSRLEDAQWSDPLTDTVFDNTFSCDGVYEIRLCALEFEAGAFDPTLMALGRVFYSVQDDEVYKVVLDGSTQIVVPTKDVFANSLHVSDDIVHLVESFSEEKARNFWCEEVGPCFVCPSEEYRDIRKVTEQMECLFDDQQYREADLKSDFSVKIKKFSLNGSLSDN